MTNLKYEVRSNDATNVANVTAAAPGSAEGLYLIVSDIQAARKELLDLVPERALPLIRR
jgi:hypothetical protein